MAVNPPASIGSEQLNDRCLRYCQNKRSACVKVRSWTQSRRLSLRIYCVSKTSSGVFTPRPLNICERFRSVRCTMHQMRNSTTNYFPSSFTSSSVTYQLRTHHDRRTPANVGRVKSCTVHRPLVQQLDRHLIVGT